MDKKTVQIKSNFDTAPTEDGKCYQSFHDGGVVCSNVLFLDPRHQLLHQASTKRYGNELYI